MSRIRAIAAFAAFMAGPGGTTGALALPPPTAPTTEVEESSFLVRQISMMLEYGNQPPVEAIKRLGPETRVVAALADVLAEGSPEQRHKASIVLGGLGTPFAMLTLTVARQQETDGEVLRTMDDVLQGGACRDPRQDLGMVRDLIEAVSAARVMEAAPVLGRLASVRPEFRPDVIQALGRMGGQAAVAELEAMRSYLQDPAERSQYQEAVKTANVYRGPGGTSSVREAPPEQAYFEQVLQKLALDYSLDVGRLPTRSEPSRLIALLDNFLAHGRSESHHTVLSLLSEIEDPVTPLVLLNVMAGHGDGIVKMQAHQALLDANIPGLEADFERARQQPLSAEGLESVFSQIEVSEARHAAPYVERLLSQWPSCTKRMVECLARLDSRESVPALMKLKLDPATVTDGELHAALQTALTQLGASELLLAQEPEKAAPEKAAPEKSEKQKPGASKGKGKAKGVGKIEAPKKEKAAESIGVARKESAGKKVAVDVAKLPKAPSTKDPKSVTKGKKSKPVVEVEKIEPELVLSSTPARMKYGSIHAARMDVLRERQTDDLVLAQARANARLAELGRLPGDVAGAKGAKNGVVTAAPSAVEERPFTALFSDEELPPPSKRKGRISLGGREMPEPYLGSIEIAKDDELVPPPFEGGGLAVPSIDGLSSMLGAAPLQHPRDHRMSRVAQNLQGEISRPSVGWEKLASRTPKKILLPALDEVMQRGTMSSRIEAARILGESTDPEATLILLDHVRRHGDLPTAKSIVKALEGWRSDRVDYHAALQHPVAEEKFSMYIEDVIRQNRKDLLPYLERLLETWPEYGVPLLRAVGHLGGASSAPFVKRYIGYRPEMDAEALGALALLGVDYELNRDRLAKALPRAAEMGEECLPIYETLLHYLMAAFQKKKDPLALRPIFYIPPHGAEPYRSQAMGVLSRASKIDPKGFIAGLDGLVYTDREEFIDEFVAYLHQKDQLDDFQQAFRKAFENLDLNYKYHETATLVQDRVGTF